MLHGLSLQLTVSRLAGAPSGSQELGYCRESSAHAEQHTAAPAQGSHNRAPQPSWRYISENKDLLAASLRSHQQHLYLSWVETYFSFLPLDAKQVGGTSP